MWEFNKCFSENEKLDEELEERKIGGLDAVASQLRKKNELSYD